MLTNRLFVLVVALALLSVAMFTMKASSAAPATVSNVRDSSDYALRHPGLAQNDIGALDWFERHLEILLPEFGADFSDYIQRHPIAINSINTSDLSDWSQRHPNSQ